MLTLRGSEVFRRASGEEVRRCEVEELEVKLEELAPVLERISIDEVVESVREDREGR